MLYDEGTGEIVREKFAQLYFRDISRLYDLTSIGYSLLFKMAKHIGLGNVNSINMYPKRKNEFAREIGCSVRQINNVLKQFEEKDIARRLEPDEYPSKYTINPEILFSGNDYQRAKIMIEYSGGERKVKAFANEEQLLKYLNEKAKNKR